MHLKIFSALIFSLRSRPTKALLACVLAAGTFVAASSTRAQEGDLPDNPSATDAATPPAAKSPAPTPTADTNEDANTWTAPDEASLPKQHTKALEESGVSSDIVKSLGPKDDYTVPLLFPPEENGIRLTDPQLKWEMTDGSRVNIGGLQIDGAKIAARWSHVTRTSIRGSHTVQIFSFSWPRIVSKAGRVTVETLKEEVKWATRVSAERSEKWRMWAVKNATTDWIEHRDSGWGIYDVNPNAFKFLKTNDVYRMCLTQTNSDSEHLKICSGAFRPDVKGADIKLIPVPVPGEATVWIEGKPIGARGIVNFPSNNDIDLKATFNNGSYVHIISHPIALKMLDVVWSKDQRDILLTGRGRVPLGSPKIIKNPKTNFWSDAGLLAKRDPVWQIALPREAPTVRVLGAFNLPFTLILKFPRLPREADRVYIREGAAGGTYSSSPTYMGYSPNGVSVSSDQQSATSEGPNKFEWVFNAPNKGGENRSRILLRSIDTPDKTWVARHTVFRSYPYELSARLSGFFVNGADTAHFEALADVAGLAWFESLGFTQNDEVSRQRWGLSYRYFTGINQAQIQNTVSMSNLSVANLDLRYNINRGIWNRDEIFGLIASVENVSLSTTDSASAANSSSSSSLLGGVGAYWARPMPDIFSSVFDIVPYFRYKKYVDADFVYYPLALQSGVSANNTFTLNFHGKIFWFPRVYGEAGLGFRMFRIKNLGSSASSAKTSSVEPSATTSTSTTSQGTGQDSNVLAIFGTFGFGMIF